MTNQSPVQETQPRRASEPKIPNKANTVRKSVEAPLLIDNLWRQIDRWVNEGGAVGDDVTLSVTEMTASHQKSYKSAGQAKFLLDRARLGPASSLPCASSLTTEL
jgi:hypothetical protein